MSPSERRSRDTTKFLNFTIGHQQGWPIEIDFNCNQHQNEQMQNQGVILETQWVDVRDGRRLMVKIRGEEFPVEFSRASDQRTARRWLSDDFNRLLCRIEGAASDSSTVETVLTFMRTPLPFNLEKEPSILVNEKVLHDLVGEKPTGAQIELATNFSVLSYLNRRALLVSTGMLGSIDVSETQPRVEMYFSNRKKLICRIEGDSQLQYLVAEKAIPCDTEILDVRLAFVPRTPRFVVNADQLVTAQLSQMRPKPHPFLEAWIEYEEVAQNKGLRDFKRRSEAPLEFDHFLSHSDSEYKVVIKSALDTLKYWIPESNRGNEDVDKLDANITVTDLTESVTAGIRATLQSLVFDTYLGRYVATISVRSTASMPTMGRIFAAEASGDAMQRQRKEQALSRLRGSATACPDLLQVIMDPSTTKQVKSAKSEYHRRANGPLLNDAQRKAVQGAVQQPSLFMVQGPPGTGKTSVIIELIYQLRRRYRNRSDNEGGPLRVLVTSVQNDAVVNAIDKLSGSEIEVYSDFGSSHTKDEIKQHRQEVQSRRLQSLAISASAKIWSKLEGSGRFDEYASLAKLRDSLIVAATNLAVAGLNQENAVHLRDISRSQDCRALTPNLASRFFELGDSLQEAVDLDLARVTKALEMQQEMEGIEKKVLQQLVTLAESEISPTKEAAENALRLIDALPIEETSEFNDCLPVNQSLITRWQRLRIQIASALTCNEFREKFIDRWSALASDTRQAVFCDTDSNVDIVESDSCLDKWFIEASELVAQLLSHIELHLEAISHNDSAVLFSWLRALNEEPSCLEEVFKRHAPVSTASCQRAMEPRKGVNDDYDVVIIDEAARAGIDILIPMTMGRSVVLIGDQNQLPPHVEEQHIREMQRGLDVDLQRESFFQWLWERVPHSNRIQLNEQYRMHEDIGRVVSNVFYDGKLDSYWTHERSKEANRLPSFGIAACSRWSPIEEQPLIWIDTADVLQDHIERTRHRVLGWPFTNENSYEGLLVFRLLQKSHRSEVLRIAKEQSSGKSIGLISFYSSQVKLLRKAVRQLGDPELEDAIEVGTVDSFQGKEYPLVILSSVRSNTEGKVGFLQLPQRVNVALSRAQRQLVVLGDSVTLHQAAKRQKRSFPLQLVFDAIQRERRTGQIIQSQELLQ